MRYARREEIGDQSLRGAIEGAERGIVDANLGGGVIKQRVPRAGQGRSGGYRILIAYRSRDRAVFLYGFAKNERDHIGDDELASLKEIAAAWLKADAGHLHQALQEGVLQEVPYDDEE